MPETNQITMAQKVRTVMRMKVRVRSCMADFSAKRFDRLDRSKAVMYLTSQSLALTPANFLYSSTI